VEIETDCGWLLLVGKSGNLYVVMCCWGWCSCEERLDLREAPLFTVLLVHVVAATSPTALQDSDLFALTLVKNFFRKYTKVSPDRIDDHAHKFRHLEADSRL
jgi:hypothetical protein